MQTKLKSPWRRLIIWASLRLLRIAGKRPQVYEHPKEMAIRRKSYLPQLSDAGYNVQKFTDYHYRINGVLDVYPVNARWHDIVKNQRGSFHGSNLATFIRRYFNEI